LCEKEVFDAKTQEIDAVRKSLIQNNSPLGAVIMIFHCVDFMVPMEATFRCPW
jgi:hypothetical protein